MKLGEIITVCLVLCAVDYTRANDDKLENDHNLIKRQAQDIHSPPSPRRHFVSPDGEPYFKYQPPVSSGRETLPGRQAASVGEVPAWKEATTRVRVAGVAAGRSTASSGTNGAQRNGASKPLAGGSRGRTYRYPFGKERVQYTGSQPQGYINDTQAGGDNGGYGLADSQQDTLVKQQQQRQQQEQQQQQRQDQQQRQEQQQRYNSVYGRPAQRSASNYQNDSSSAAASQDVNAADLQEQEIRRRHEELRRRHEEERRRQEEERRKLIEERRKNDEERRRLYYEQQQQRANQQRGNGQGETGSQQSGLHGNRQGAAIPTVNTEQRAADSDQSSRQEAQRRDSNIQQGYEASSNQQATPNISQHRGRVPPHQQSAHDDSRQGGSQPQQSVYNSAQQGGNLPQHQKPTYSGSQQSRYLPQHQQPPYSASQQSASQPQQQPNSGNQQGGYLPPHQQPTYSGSQQAGSQPQQPTVSGSQQRGYQPQQPTYSGSQHGGYQAQHQQPVYNPAQRHSPDRQTIFRLNNTQSANPQDTHQQQSFSQVHHHQPPDQVDPWLQQRSNLSSARSNRDYSGQGQGQRYPYPGRGANLGSSFSYEQQDTDLDCPETGIDLRINGLDCQQAVQQFGTYLCYTHEFTSRDCCQVCRPRKQVARTGCEYGDHAELCSSITPADCYDLRNRYSCCETCERLKRHHLPAGCEYGDMTARCDNVRQTPGLCYVPDNQRLCCETCNQIRNLTNTGCPWGDYHPNLCQLFDENTSNVRINCYSKQRQKLCCQSCERLRGWISPDLPAGCQYGDRPVIFTTSEFGRLNCSTLFSYFSTDECRTNDAVATNCCHTCHRLLNHRG